MTDDTNDYHHRATPKGPMKLATGETDRDRIIRLADRRNATDADYAWLWANTRIKIARDGLAYDEERDRGAFIPGDTIKTAMLNLLMAIDMKWDLAESVQRVRACIRVMPDGV